MVKIKKIKIKKVKLRKRRSKSLISKKVRKSSIKVKFRKSKSILRNKYTIKIKDFGKKKIGRKGKYFYIKVKGKSAKYYKYQPNISRKELIYFYNKGIVTKRGGINKTRIRKEFKLDKSIQRFSKLYPNIEDSLKYGYSEYLINDAKKLNSQSIRSSYVNLLSNKDKSSNSNVIVNDPDLLAILTTSENIEKWKFRLMYEIILKNENGEVLCSLNNTNVKTLGEIKKEVIDNLFINQDFEGQYRKISMIVDKYNYRSNKGITNKGRLTTIQIKMVFRKGGKK